MTWLVALTEPKAEPLASHSAERRGFTAFWPRIKRTISRRGRRSAVIDSLFPGYLFLYVTDTWREVLSLRGVRGVIMADERPIAVSDAVVDGVKSRCDGLGFYRGYQLERFKVGDRVTPQRGPLMSLTGTYAASPHDGVEVALFELLGAKARPVEFTHGVLVAAAE